MALQDRNPFDAFDEAPQGASSAPFTVRPLDTGTKPKDPPSGYRWKENGNLEPIPGGNADPDAKKNDAVTRVDERKASAFLTRALGSNTSYEQTKVGPRSLVGQTMANAIPGVLNTLPSNVGNSPGRQVADSAQDEFIAATLRQDSGAAIPEKELERQRRIYFPMAGDGPEAIAQKRAARLRAMAGLRASAGNSIDATVRAALDPYSADIDAAIKGEPANPSGDVPKEFNALTPSNIAEFATGLSGGKYTITEAGMNYDAGNGKPEPIDVSDDILNSVEYRQAYYDKFHKWPGIHVSVTGGLPYQGETQLDKDRGTAGGAVDAFVRGAADIPTFGLADELEAGRKTLFEGGTMRDNMRDQSAIDRADERINPWLRFGGQLAGAAVPLGAIGRATTPLRMGAQGAGLSGAYAFGSTDGSFAERAAAVPGAAVVGGLTGYGLGTLAQRIGRIPPGAPPGGGVDAYGVARAAQEEGVPISRAFVDPTVRNKLTALETTRGGNAAIRSGLNETSGAIEGRVGALGEGGTALDTQVAGQTVRNAAERFIKQSGAQARRNYDKAERLSGDAKVAPVQSVQQIDDILSRLKETPETTAREISYLEGLKKDLGKDLSVGGLRRVRTRLRRQISDNALTFGEDEANVLGVMDAASQDIANGLKAAGRGEAADAFSAADSAYRKRMDFIGGTIKKLIGSRSAPASPEATFSRFQSMATPKGDAASLGKMIDALNPEEKADMVATVIAPLGRDAAGAFSPAMLISQAAKLSPGARVRLFGREGADSLGRLLKVSEQWRDVTRNLNNSRTGVATNYRSRIASFLGLGSGAGGGAIGYAMAGPGGGMGGAALGLMGAKAAAGAVENLSDRLSARALMNTDMSKWLEEVPRATTPEKIASHIRKLNLVATRNPAISDNVVNFMNYLQRAASETPLRAAASDKEQK